MLEHLAHDVDLLALEDLVQLLLVDPGPRGAHAVDARDQDIEVGGGLGLEVGAILQQRPAGRRAASRVRCPGLRLPLIPCGSRMSINPPTQKRLFLPAFPVTVRADASVSYGDLPGGSRKRRG